MSEWYWVIGIGSALFAFTGIVRILILPDQINRDGIFADAFAIMVACFSFGVL